MTNPNILKGRIVEKGLTISHISKELDISRATFYRKLKEGSFTIGQANQICDLLQIEDPVAKCEIFLPGKSQK